MVVGFGRSGSTLVGEILNAHSRIAISDESYLFHQAALGLASFKLKIRRQVVRKAWARYLEDIYREYARKRGAKRYGDKTPAMGITASLVDEILAGKCLFVWTVRNPIDQALSWLERFGSSEKLYSALDYLTDVSSFKRGPNASIQALLYCYSKHIGSLHRLMLHCPSRVFVCHYERLVQETNTVLKEMHKFIGDRVEDGQLEKVFGKVHRRVPRGDPKFTVTSTIHADSLYRWRNLSGKELNRFLKYFGTFKIDRCMRYLGYPTPYYIQEGQ